MMSTRKSILRKMVAIVRMERGTLCPMRGGRYHNLQSWEKGRNRVRYVPASQIDDVREAVEGYRTFMDLARKYADLVVQDTRKASEKARSVPERAQRARN